MNISDVVGSKVMVLFHTAKGLERLGIDDTSKYCRIVGYDNIGLWVENPSYEETPIRNEDGSLIAPEDRQKHTYAAHVLVPWANIRALAYFPSRVEKELESEEVRGIGSYL
ncbi:MAG: hypothetical protein V3T14_11970 [Myxococcota bacterium]